MNNDEQSIRVSIFPHANEGHLKVRVTFRTAYKTLYIEEVFPVALPLGRAYDLILAKARRDIGNMMVNGALESGV